jgi:hypothetical protein
MNAPGTAALWKIWPAEDNAGFNFIQFKDESHDHVDQRRH